MIAALVDPKTADIRKVQNSSGYGVTATEVIMGNDGDVLPIGDDAKATEKSQHEEKESDTDDKERLNLNQKLMARMAHNINSFSTALSDFVSKSVESTRPQSLTSKKNRRNFNRCSF